jgi:very-short-patch-repair endonuclease
VSIAALRRINRQIVEDRGWRHGTDIEDRVAIWLSQAGFRPGETVEQQYRVGRYRLDFAFPDVKMGLEVDGWHHRSPEGAARDAERDSWLRSQGWLILRVDDRHGEDSFSEQVDLVCWLVNASMAKQYEPLTAMAGVHQEHKRLFGSAMARRNGR